MRRTAQLAILVVLAVLATGCRVHIVGDSTAWLVQYWAQENDVTITGTPVPSCGFTSINGDRALPDDPLVTYPTCVTDWNGSTPDDPDDVIFGFVSIHDAMCSSADGCQPIDTTAYLTAHADLTAMGHPVVWVEVPPVGGPTLQARMAELNAEVAVALGCTLVPYSVRQAPMWDGLHYLEIGGLQVGYRLAEIAENPTPC